MRWSYLLFLPALVSIGWAVVTLLTKKRPTHAQMLFSFMLILEGVAMMALAVFFRGKAGSLFIYHYTFELLAVLCGPMYYLTICSLVEPRGVTLSQRRVFFIPLTFILVLTILAFVVGPLQYERMCYLIRYGEMVSGEPPLEFLLFWSRWVFYLLLVGVNFVLLLMANRKIRLFQERFNAFYADDISAPKLHTTEVNVLTWIFLPLSLAVVLIIAMRPYMYKYYLIVLAVIIAVLQFFIGRVSYRLDYDAHYLARYISENKNISSSTVSK